MVIIVRADGDFLVWGEGSKVMNSMTIKINFYRHFPPSPFKASCFSLSLYAFLTIHAKRKTCQVPLYALCIKPFFYFQYSYTNLLKAIWTFHLQFLAINYDIDIIFPCKLYSMLIKPNSTSIHIFLFLYSAMYIVVKNTLVQIIWFVDSVRDSW